MPTPDVRTAQAVENLAGEARKQTKLLEQQTSMLKEQTKLLHAIMRNTSPVIPPHIRATNFDRYISEGDDGTASTDIE